MTANNTTPTPRGGSQAPDQRKQDDKGNPKKSQTPGGPDCQGESAIFFGGSDFGPAGSALWADLAVESDPFSLTVLVIEACRLADRLTKLDLLLRGDIDTWARLTHRTLTDDYELKIDSAAAEARQTAGALRQILTEIRRQKSEQDNPGGDDPLDDL